MWAKTLRWICGATRTGCTWRITAICMWCEQATIEWSRRVISIVACCHSVELCALAARDFRSQQHWGNSQSRWKPKKTDINGENRGKPTKQVETTRNRGKLIKTEKTDKASDTKKQAFLLQWRMNNICESFLFRLCLLDSDVVEIVNFEMRDGD